MKVLAFFFVFLAVLFSFETHAQTKRSGKIGIGYSGNFTSQTNEIGLSVWIADKLTLEPQIGLRRVSVEDNSATNWKPGLGILFRISNSEISPYVGFRARMSIISGTEINGEEQNYSDFIGSLAFGGDYFFSEWFSVGAELRLNYISTDEKYSPSYIADANIIETEQVMNFRIYLR